MNCWLYQKISEWKFDAGFFNPKGDWILVRSFDNENDCAVYVNYLNGGGGKFKC